MIDPARFEDPRFTYCLSRVSDPKVPDGKKLVFRANGTYRGFPTASLYCAKPGSVTVSWGGRKMTVKEIAKVNATKTAVNTHAKKQIGSASFLQPQFAHLHSFPHSHFSTFFEDLVFAIRIPITFKLILP